MPAVRCGDLSHELVGATAASRRLVWLATDRHGGRHEVSILRGGGKESASGEWRRRR